MSIKPPPGFVLDDDEDEDTPPPPPGFSLDAKPAPAPKPQYPSLGMDSLAGARDGDTLRLDSGRNLRLWGVDAPELNQQGWDRQGQAVPIGEASKAAIARSILDGAPRIGQPVSNSWGRPVAPVTIGGRDLGQTMARTGQAMAAPDFLKDDPARQFQYMQAERLARLNSLGIHDTMFQPPADFRKAPMPVPDKETVARFWDTPTPWAGLRPDVEKQLTAMIYDPAVSLEDAAAYVKANGGILDMESAKASRESFLQGNEPQALQYRDQPKILTEMGDGRTGAAVRGVGDGILAGGLDEVGAAVDTLGLTANRENIWNSDRRLADIWANNQDQNSSILGYDDQEHFGYRLGGQIAGGLAVPFGAGARTVPQLFRVGAAYGGAEGFLGTDGDLGQRAIGAAIGVPVGGAVGAAGGKALEYGIPLAARALRGRGGRPGGPSTAGLDDIASAAPARTPDYLDINDVPAPPAGFTIDPPEPVQTAYPGPLGIAPDPSAASFRLLEYPARYPLNENYVTSLRDHTPRVWRETSPDQLEPFLPTGSAANDHYMASDMFMSDNPDLALGQGRNRGVVMEFDTDGLQGKVSLDKPTARQMYEQGMGSEYVTRNNRAPDYQKALRSIRIKDDANLDRVTAERLPRALSDLEQAGWVATRGDGFVQYDRPDVVAALQGSSRDRDWIDIGEVPPPPPGFKLDEPQGPRSMGMDAEPMPSISQPVRQPDYLDMGPSRAVRMDQPLTDAQRQAMAQGIDPRDVLPIPSNQVADLDEAMNIEAGRMMPATAADEATALESRAIKARTGTVLRKRGPVDLVTWLRGQGGIKDQGGELSAMGIGNEGRDLDFARGEQRFGRLVDNDNGMNLDDAAFRAWEAGYLPGSERPDIDAFLDAVGRTHSGSERFYLPEDLPEVERFEGLRADRLNLEDMQARGPVYDDRSVPADEPPPLPPVEAYEEWPAGGPDFAGNINLGKLSSPQDISRALNMTQRRVGFDAATRGRVSQAETERLAAELNLTPEKLIARRKGQAFNAEEALAARQILAKSGNELVNAAKRIKSLGDDPGSEALADFREKWVRHVAIQEQVAGMTAEAGRALQQFRQMADSRAVRGDVLSAMVRGGGGPDRLRKAADVLLDAVELEPGKFNAFTEEAMKPKWANKLSELYVNFLLSFPQTHAVNVVSNTLTAMAQIPEYAVAGAVGAVRQVMPRANAERVTGSEIGRRAFGLLQGTREGSAMFAKALRTGEPSDFISKVEGQEYKAISGIKGEAIRLPTRFLTAEDELFKGIARRMELNGLAARQAYAEGMRGDAASKRIAELISDPTDEMMQAAEKYGRYLTFQTPLAGLAQDVSTAAQRNPLIKLYLPFVRTPTNLLKFAVERSPAAPMIESWRKDMIAGGARRDLAVAKSLIGTGMGLAMYEAATNGLLTGSVPSDQKKARLLYADGWKPYSIKIGDTYYSYKRLDPFSTTLGVAADLALLPEGMSERQKEDKVTLFVASILGNLASKTWLSGVTDAVGALHDPEQNASRMLNRLVGSLLIPNLIAGTARTLDPVQRETETLGDALQARIPFLRDDLPARRDIWGRVVKNEGGIGPDWLSPVWTSQQLNDPVNKELLQTDYSPGHPNRKVKGRELTPQEYDRYSEQAGKAAHAALLPLVTSQEWKAMDPDEKAAEARKVVDAARKAVRDGLFGGGGDDDTPAPPAGFSVDGVPPPPPGFQVDGVPPPPPGFSMDGASGGRNVYADLQGAIPGVQFTSGYRTPEYQEDMRRRGYKPAYNSSHLDGSALDMLPPPGKSMGWLKQRVREYEPDAKLLIHDGHLHATFPGYYGAPVLGGARSRGLSNPLSNMPAPPPGFTLD